MGVRQDTLWEQFLKPIIGSFINQDELRKFSESVDWEREYNRFCDPTIDYPEYYTSGNFHGIEGGYLTSSAAVTYDPITQYVLPPNETWVREELIKKIQGQPRTILDLGCGTGSTTLMLKQAFPHAEVIGLDLSPYMLFMADYKTRKAGLNIEYCHGKAEATGLQNESFDLITASLLFHETPGEISQAILRECFRLLIPGGQVAILDGNQNALRQMEWLTNVFEEPYIFEYAVGNVKDGMERVGFQAVQTDDIWLIHQVTHGMKPLSAQDPAVASSYKTVYDSLEDEFGETPAPAF